MENRIFESKFEVKIYEEKNPVSPYFGPCSYGDSL